MSLEWPLGHCCHGTFQFFFEKEMNSLFRLHEQDPWVEQIIEGMK